MDIVAIYGSRASEATKNRRDRTARHGPLHDKCPRWEARWQAQRPGRKESLGGQWVERAVWQCIHVIQ